VSSRTGRLDRRLQAVAPHGQAATAAGAVVELRDSWGQVQGHYDLETLALPKDMARMLAEAFRQHHAASTPEMCRGCWKALQSFARFVAEDGAVRSLRDLDTAAVGRYIAWLDRQVGPTGEPRSRKGRANVLSGLRQLVDWMKRHHPGALAQRIDFPYRVYPDLNAQPRKRLPEDQLKTILRACYEDINAAWARFELGREILRSAAVPQGASVQLHGLVRALAGVDGGVMPARLTLVAHGFNMAAIAREGGLRSLAGYLHLTGETAVPFFVALAIQLAANPHPLARMGRECLRAHPLDEHRVIVEWDKARGGGKVRRAQRRSFDRRRRHAAPNLIDKLLAMTEPLVERAGRDHRGFLFLVVSEKTRHIAPISLSTLTHTLKAFIARANARIAIWNQAAPERARVPLPDFAAVLLRGSVATEHYRASGGDILHVQQILNHGSAVTTEAYVIGPSTEQLRRETVARLQKLMVSWLTGPAGTAPPSDRPMPAAGVRATAPFGHDCLNPLDGSGPGAQTGRVCAHLGGCLRCPGLVIPLDEAHLARILLAKEEFERARERLDARRWELLYASSYRILVQDILPDFPEAMHAPAAMLAKRLPPLPMLE
jgi:site-specific recombinase XerD